MKNQLQSVWSKGKDMGDAAEVIGFKDGDGGGNDSDNLCVFNIETVSNGFILKIEDDEGELTEVHDNIDDVFSSIRKYI